MLVIISESPR